MEKRGVRNQRESKKGKENHQEFSRDRVDSTGSEQLYYSTVLALHLLQDSS